MLHTVKRLINYLLFTKKPAWVARNWSGATDHEVAYWNTWVADDGGKYAEDFKDRLNPNFPLQDQFTALLNAPEGTEVTIVDVGAGPCTYIGKVYPGRTVNLIPVDPLADQYAEIWSKNGLTVPIPTRKCMGEDLRSMFEDHTANLVYSRNALDHAIDPIKIIRGMIAICKPGGHVLIDLEENEGQNEGYAGLHQWNFGREKGDLILWRPGFKVPLGQFMSQCGDLNVTGRDGWISICLRVGESWTFPTEVSSAGTSSLVKYAEDLA